MEPFSSCKGARVFQAKMFFFVLSKKTWTQTFAQVSKQAEDWRKQPNNEWTKLFVFRQFADGFSASLLFYRCRE